MYVHDLERREITFMKVELTAFPSLGLKDPSELFIITPYYNNSFAYRYVKKLQAFLFETREHQDSPKEEIFLMRHWRGKFMKYGEPLGDCKTLLRDKCISQSCKTLGSIFQRIKITADVFLCVLKCTDNSGSFKYWSKSSTLKTFTSNHTYKWTKSSVTTYLRQEINFKLSLEFSDNQTIFRSLKCCTESFLCHETTFEISWSHFLGQVVPVLSITVDSFSYCSYPKSQNWFLYPLC